MIDRASRTTLTYLDRLHLRTLAIGLLAGGLAWLGTSQPTHAAEQQAAGTADVTTLNIAENADTTLLLPSYETDYAWSSADPKELGITQQQEKKLREVYAAYQKSMVTAEPELAKHQSATPQEFAEYMQHRQERIMDVARKQVEAVFTPKQFQTWQTGVFCEAASGLLASPNTLQAIGATPQQKKGLQDLNREFAARRQRDMERVTARVLAALNPQQIEKLRVETERRHLALHGVTTEDQDRVTFSGTVSGNGTTTVQGTGTFDLVVASNYASDSPPDLILPIYEELGQADLRKRLDVSPAQQKQLQQIASDYQTDITNLAADTIRRDEILRKFQPAVARVKQRIESLLTPKQAAAIKDIWFQNTWWIVLYDPKVQEKIGLDSKQKEAVRHPWEHANAGGNGAFRALAEQKLALFTPEQHGKLRAELSRLKEQRAKEATAMAHLAGMQQALESGNLQAGAKLVAEAAKIAPDSLAVQLYRGIVSLMQKDYRAAEEWFDKALAQSPAWFPASNNLALALCEQHDPAKMRRALECVQTNAQVYLDNGEAASTRAWVLYKAGRLDDAERFYRKSAAIGKVSQDTAYYGARIAFDRGHKDEAKQLLATALAADTYFCMRPEAESLLTELDPDSPRAWHVGDSLRVIAVSAALRDPADAAKTLRTVETGKTLKLVKIEHGRLLVSGDGFSGEGWIQDTYVAKAR